ncbi:MAG TPA: hypothetical protein VGS07_16685 [Thermoanaerobaculia bacterium]|jgi:hypothetical protein|nr:hypothetical protein [Thermoanaerobaculia bacterium]
MTSYQSLRIGLVAALLVVLLAVAAVPVNGQPVHSFRQQAVHVAGFGDRLWNLLVNLLPRAWQKEGMSIDPNGSRNAVNPNPPVLPNEGVTIDPNG